MTRADRQQQKVAQVLCAMRQGAILQLYYANGRELWRLWTGLFVTPEAAAEVVTHPDIRDSGDGLFEGVRGQTWRLGAALDHIAESQR